MMRLEIASPSPVPPFAWVIEIVGLLKFLEQLGLIGFADPWAGIAHRQVERARWPAATLITTSPASVNLMALPTRLSRTCVSRRSSPWPCGRSGGSSILRAMFFSSTADGSTAL